MSNPLGTLWVHVGDHLSTFALGYTHTQLIQTNDVLTVESTDALEERITRALQVGGGCPLSVVVDRLVEGPDLNSQVRYLRKVALAKNVFILALFDTHRRTLETLSSFYEIERAADMVTSEATILKDRDHSIQDAT